MAINEALFSSASCEWTTPQDFFDKWDAKYHFDLDCCATVENAKCPRYFTKEDDAFKHKWTGRVWMNPPYGKEIGKWMQKAYESVRSGDAEVVVCLVPSRTDTRWFHEYAMKGTIDFIRGRLKFGGVATPHRSHQPLLCLKAKKKEMQSYEAY